MVKKLLVKKERKNMTLKQYKDLIEKRRELAYTFDQANKKISGKDSTNENVNLYVLAKKKLEKFDKEMEKMKKQTSVLVHESIGGRSFYGSVVKIGKNYYDEHASNINQYVVEEIDKVTLEMIDEMNSDLYY